MTRLSNADRAAVSAANAALGRALLPTAPTAPTAAADRAAARPLNNPALACNGVRDWHDRRRVVYWRYRLPGSPAWVGAVKHVDGQWKATGWPLDGRHPGPRVNVELGAWPTRAQAEASILTYARPRRAK
jgi:hypothetical protein